MSDFNIRSDSVNVEQIMHQIRARIREKRGVDYTEQQIQELASARLERFLDPQKVRSDLLEQFRTGIALSGTGPVTDDPAGADRRPSLLRRAVHPIEVLCAWPLHKLRGIRKRLKFLRYQADYTQLTFELLHNLVVETTRLGIEVKNLKMRVESLSGRFEFGERRARALEGVVQYKPSEAPEAPRPDPNATPSAGDDESERTAGGELRRKRRRRRGRRGNAPRATNEETGGGAPGGGGEPVGQDGRAAPSPAGPGDGPAGPAPVANRPPVRDHEGP